MADGDVEASRMVKGWAALRSCWSTMMTGAGREWRFM